MRVLGKHSRAGFREDAYGMFGAVSAFKAMQKARPEAKPDNPLFTEHHREGIKELLREANLRKTRKAAPATPRASGRPASPCVSTADPIRITATSPRGHGRAPR